MRRTILGGRPRSRPGFDMSSALGHTTPVLATSGGTTPVIAGQQPVRKRSVAGLTGPDSTCRLPGGILAVGAPPIAAIMHDDPRRKKQASKNQPIVRAPTQKQIGLFAHLQQYDRQSSLSHGLIQAKTLIHPSIIRLGLLYSDYKVIGANARCREMLLAFKDVIRDYQLPNEQVLARHLERHLSPLIAFLIQARPLAVSMGQAIRQLKLKISTISPDVHESEAKKMLYESIDAFLLNRIDLADQLIVQHGLTKIFDGDVILTFSRSQVVKELLIAAFRAGKSFRVIIVDARPFFEGKRLLNELVDAGLSGRCTYVNLNALGYIIKEVTKTIIGAHCIYSNGALVSRVGTAMVALMSRRANAPVIACVESLKFSERVQLDSFVMNEIGDPDVLVSQHLRPGFPEPLAGWRDVEPLKLLNILYDVTSPEHVSMVISEVGLIPVTSIPVVLREYNTSMLV